MILLQKKAESLEKPSAGIIVYFFTPLLTRGFLPLSY